MASSPNGIMPTCLVQGRSYITFLSSSLILWQEGEWEDHRSGSVWLREINGDEFTTMFLPYFGNMVQRVVSEEVEKAKFKQFSAAAATPPRMLGSQGLGRYRFISLGRWPLLSMVDLHVSGHKRTRIWLCSTTTTTKPGSARDLNLKLLTATFVDFLYSASIGC
ncbi:uncharacterized protein [Aegilops tauschii subsp. strangulata]|uniref:uncharacterized protein isoform X2 n=1 Tax=Aegilops tauschii subsp. strangulata TaxID=200361 RepID=UPI001ABD4713|nr:uncharacterized protein LOC109780525 isoform X3 [Aegilops tauschii subsp. strangulata]XP_044450217.1 uncharacterized protein LOC123181879 isoform X3 [Triticum aestivum]